MAKAKADNKEKISYLWFVPEILCILFGLLVILLTAWIRKDSMYDMLRDGVMTGLSFAGFGLLVRKFFPVYRSEYKLSIQNLGRFWLLFAGSMILAIVCGFLPNAIWPFLPIFVLLSLYGSPVLGVAGGSILLELSILLSGSSGIGIFFLYLVTGLVAIGALLPIREDSKLVKGMIISLLCLLSSEFAVIVLSNNARLSFDLIAFPLLNTVVSFLVVFFGIRYYASKVMFRMRDRYLLLNDTEHPSLVAMKERSRREYKQSIHTANFCERIGNKLNMNVDALKCAGLYHRLCPLKEEDRNVYFEDMNFPGDVREILTEYTDYLTKKARGRIVRKESAVLFCSQTIIMAVLSMFEKDKDAQINMDKIVDMTFQKFDELGVFSACEISVKELLVMKQTFKEDKLYYDFLR